MRENIENQIREDAAGDAAFRTALIADPAHAILERYGVAIPDGVTLRIVEEAADEVVLVLPSAAAAQVLSPAELDAVTGASYRGVFTEATANPTA